MDKKEKRNRRKMRVRAKIFGMASRPRLSIFRSNKHIFAQLIDDQKGTTLSALSSAGLATKDKLTKIEKAYQTGRELAKMAKKLKISTVVFDRSGYQYHGRVKALLDGARKEGLRC